MAANGVPFDELIPPPTQVNNSNIDYSIASVIIALGVITSLTVLARLVYRYSSRNFGLDDYSIVPALIIYLAWTTVAAYFVLHSGISKPIGNITYAKFTLFYKGVYVIAWMYPIMSASVRVSILLFYRRIFAKGSTFYDITTLVLLGLQAVYIIAFEILPALWCRPLSDAVEPRKRLTACSHLYINAVNIYISSTIALYSISLAFDIILLLLPLVPIWKLHISVRKRIRVLVIFALGAGASVTAAYKLAIFVDQGKNHILPSNPNWFKYQASTYIPPQYTSYGKLIWIPTHVEPTVALIGTSLPAILKIYKLASEHISKVWSSQYDSKEHAQHTSKTEDISANKIELEEGAGPNQNSR